MSLVPNILNENLLGIDISQSSGDIATVLGDFKTQNSIANVIDAFIRELTTPLGYIGRYVLDIDGLKIVDSDYGNEAYYQLSEPLSDSFINNMIGHIQTVADAHQNRLTISSIDYNILNLIENKVQFLVSLLIQSDLPPIQLLLSRTGNQLTADILNN